ncbi:MAG: DUF6599 family protein [Bacteroidota bacterium]|jgi:hypothetical protein
MNLIAQTNFDPARSLPNEINGWNNEQSDRLFDNETLFDYIDGSAEMFLSFGFSKVFNRIYSRDNQPDIIVDIFFMNSSYDAYGVFTHSVGKLEHEFGQQSQRSEGAIIFWKSNYYVSILCHPETPESRNTISKLAGLIDESIKETGPLPEVINYISKENLIEESVRYFRHYNWLNSHTFISNYNILNIEQNTHGILARYNTESDSVIFLLIMYPDESDAGLALNKFIDSYTEKLIPGQIKQTKNSLWLGVNRINNFVIGIFDSSSKELASIILDRAIAVINK